MGPHISVGGRHLLGRPKRLQNVDLRGETLVHVRVPLRGSACSGIMVPNGGFPVLVKDRPRTFAVVWLLVWGAAGTALMLYRGLVDSEGPCRPGWPHCGMVLGHPLVWLGVVVWILGLITTAVLWQLMSFDADPRKRAARSPADRHP
jgi:hypothetical protein